jgi:hypothetical protein
MPQPRANDLASRARSLFQIGKKLVQEGFSDAEYLVNATANAARLHMTIRRNQFAKHRILHQMGKALLNALPADPARREIQVTEEMRKLARQIGELEAESERAEGEIALISVVRKGNRPPAKGSEPPFEL